MSDLQELEGPIDAAIANALIEATPDHWKAADMTISRTDHPNRTQVFLHAITSPEGHGDIVVATEALLRGTCDLADLFDRVGRPWKQVVYRVSQQPDGNWKYTASFSY